MKKSFSLLLVCLIALQVAVKAQNRIYWGIPGSNISSALFDGTDVNVSVALSGQIYDMETDFYKNIIYWGDGATVKKANTDGTNKQTLYTGTGSTGGLALDLVNNKLYFSEFGGTHVIIRRCNLDGTGLEIVLTSPISSASTYTLSISPTLQKLYWTEYSTSSFVMRCNLDGTNVETLMTVSNFMPGLAIDEKNQRLYLAYWNDNQVMTTDMTCSITPTLVFGSSNGTFQMAVSNEENKLYFGEMNSGKVRKCNLDGTSPQDIVPNAGRIMALSIPTVPPAPTIAANDTYTFELNDFLFSSVDQSLLTKIQITSTVDKGNMYLDANSNNIVDAGETVTLNQEISRVDIVTGKLKFNPVTNEYGSPYTSFNFKWNNGTSYSTFEYIQYIYVLTVAPIVTTQAVSNISSTTATANGNVTNLGVPFPTSYGVCWNTTGTPTISNSEADKGAASATGAFTASMTGLTVNTTYYVRAYATNAVGTSFGTEVSFITQNTPMTLTFNTSLGTDNIITLPLRGTLNVTVNWGDGNSNTYAVTGNQSHTYSSAGTYTVTISGSMTGYGFGAGTGVNAEKLVSVTGFGNLGLTSLSGAFTNALNLTTVPASLPSTVTDMSSMFKEATAFNQNIGSWNVSNVTTMESMFVYATAFNQNIGSWVVSNVTTMKSMFAFASAFNQNIGDWNVSNVTNMASMFYRNYVFNQDISKWNVAKVTDMSSMFSIDPAFNQDISGWDVSKVTNMSNMFYWVTLSTTNYNALLTGWAAKTLKPNVTFDGGYSKYNSGAPADARALLTSTPNSWIITDGGIINQAPTDITLSASAIDENVTANSTVGTLSSTDPDAGNTFTYTFVSGTGSTDNASFNISGSSLRITNSPDFETKSSYSVRLRTTDLGGLYFEKAFTITINDLAEAPKATTNAATSVTSTGATLNGNINANGISTTVTFEYGLTTGYGTTVTATPSPVTGSSATSVSKAITGLLAGNTYHYIVVGVNSAGTSYGTDVSFTTSAAAPIVTTQAVSSIATNTATGNGNITSLGSPNPTQYGVVWSTSTGPTVGLTSKTAQGSASSTGAFTSSITGLTAGTLYYIRAYATNSISTAYGTEVSFTPLRKSQTVTFDPLPTKTFGDSNFPPVASASSGLAVTFSSSNTDVVTIVSSNIHIVGPGTAVLTASQAGDATWLPASATQIFTADKSDQTITFDAIPAKTYGSTDMDLLASATSGLTIDYSSDNTAVVTVVNGKIHIIGAGSANIAANQSGNANFNTATEVIQILTVNKAMITVTSDPKIKIYGSVNPALTIQYSGFVIGDDATDLTAVPAASTAVNNATNVGVVTDAITIGGGVDENYDFTYVADDFTVTKANLTVTADAKTKVYGEANPVLTFLYSGWVNGVETIDAAPSITTTVDGTTIVGTYTDAITLSGGLDNNYTFSFVAGAMDVTKAILTATAEPKTKAYGSDNPALTIFWTGFKNNDEVTVINELPSITTLALKASDIGTYDITITGGDDNNYDLNLVNGSLDIEKAPLVIMAEDKAKTYLEPNPELTFTWSGFVLGQNQDVIDVVPALETIANKNSDAGTYDIIASGGVDGNYSFTYENGTLAIDKADQVITFEEIPAGLRTTQDHQLIAETISGLTITFETSDPIIGSINGATLTVNKEGNLTITASQPGNQNWNPAKDVTREIVTLPTFDNLNSLFTPNNDGMNDFWYIPDLEKYGRLQVTVYNRFGQKVYGSDGYKNDWDGTWNGYPLPSASYYYIMRSSTKGFIKGVVNLVR